MTLLDAAQLRKRCDPDTLGVADSTGLARRPGLRQSRATEAIDFGLAMTQPGYHVFVMGEHGSGRHVTVHQRLQTAAEARPVPPDLCYVHNFDDPFAPRLLEVPAGTGARLRQDMTALLRAIGPAIDAALDAENHQRRVEALESAHKQREEQALRELGHASEADSLSLLRTPEGFVFAPIHNGAPMAPEAYDALPEAERDEISARVERYTERLQSLLDGFPQWRAQLQAAMERAVSDALRPTIANLLKPLETRYAEMPAIVAFLAAVKQDLLESGDAWAGTEEGEAEEDEFTLRFHRYQVNLLVDNGAQQGAPIVTEENPGFGNLIGRIEQVARMGTLVTNFSLIRGGALHRANGGYLVLDANRLFAQPFAWEGLKRALRARQIRIEPPAEAQHWNSPLTLEPEAAPCALKVVLIGDRDTYYLLSEYDTDFAELFKVVADFDDELPRTAENERHFIQMLATLAEGAELLPISAAALAAMVEHGARLADDAHRLALQTRVLADTLREADYFARRGGHERIEADDVAAALDARRRRHQRYPEQVLDSMLDGTVMISTDGLRAGQINGLVVIEMAGERFGHPTRITATARVGEGDVVDIERETDLGGAIHSKGVFILSAFLAARFARHQPLSLTASLVFEQSYSPVEGDSASLGELCALLSALADVPIRQSMAVTGSVNQFGEVQAIGGVNEKIEGFFELCSARGLTGEQGVVIPRANVRHLMLREDVVAATVAGRFHVHAVSTVDEAMGVLTGRPAGAPDAKGVIPKDSINDRVARTLARMANTRHGNGQGGAHKAHGRSRIQG
jgi:lon-related putative ATP-dependent protease